MQLEYAALDAAVLVHIFRHVGKQPQPSGAPDGHAKIEWKSYIVQSLSLPLSLSSTPSLIHLLARKRCMFSACANSDHTSIFK